MYLSISPRMRDGQSVEYCLYQAALDIAGEESIGTWDPDLKTTDEDEADANTQHNMEILKAKVIGLNIRNGMTAIAFPVEGFEFGNLPQLLSVIIGNYNGMTSAAYGVTFRGSRFPR